jgi:hypothetical protein
MSTDLQPQAAGPGRSRLHALIPIAVFDIAGPLAVYYAARIAGCTQITALILSGIIPALGIARGIVRTRHISPIGVLVLAGIVGGTIAGLLTQEPKLVLMEGSVSTLILAAGCLASLLTRQPLMYSILIETIGTTTPKGRLLQQARTHPAAQPLFTRITLTWGVALLAEVVTRIAIIETLGTGPALLLLKVMPYAVTGLLIRWTMRAVHHSPAFAGFARPAPASTAPATAVPATAAPAPAGAAGPPAPGAPASAIPVVLAAS